MRQVWVDIRTPAPQGPPLGIIEGFASQLIEVSDLRRALDFYTSLLGFALDGETAEGPRVRLNEAQCLVLVPKSSPRTFPGSGVHWAYRFPSEELKRVLARLETAGVEVARYHEDRPREAGQNRYLADPDGNRVQLVMGEGSEVVLDHVAVEVHDLEWAEVFYTHVLGGRVEARVGWRMEDYDRALEWGAGRDQCAPGTRRWDKRYTTIEGQARVPRPNAHIFVSFGMDVTVGLYLATEHRQEPPPEVFCGTPRFGYRVAKGRLEELEERLRCVRLRCLQVSEVTGGPFERRDGSLFVKDPGGNFLQFDEAGRV